MEPWVGSTRSAMGFVTPSLTFCAKSLHLIWQKPSADDAPSNLAIAGRYVLTAEIFPCLERVTPDRKGETQLTNALRILLGQAPMHGMLLEGCRHDIGNKLDFLKANLLFGLEHPELGKPLRAFLQEIMAETDD